MFLSRKGGPMKEKQEAEPTMRELLEEAEEARDDAFMLEYEHATSETENLSGSV
jgi:hypothetical protein